MKIKNRDSKIFIAPKGELNAGWVIGVNATDALSV
jgi:hypothetical protein